MGGFVHNAVASTVFGRTRCCDLVQYLIGLQRFANCLLSRADRPWFASARTIGTATSIEAFSSPLRTWVETGTCRKRCNYLIPLATESLKDCSNFLVLVTFYAPATCA